MMKKRHNKTLHQTAIALRSLAAGELCQFSHSLRSGLGNKNNTKGGQKMNSISILKVIAVLSLLTLTTPVFAEDYSGGATIVPVAENLPQSRFNLKTDAASIYIEKA